MAFVVPKTVEELDKLFNNASSIRELRKHMEARGATEQYEALVEEKIIEIFKEGQYEGIKLTGEQIKRVINKDHKVLNELMGEERVSILFKEAEIAEKKEIKAARRKRYMYIILMILGIVMFYRWFSG